MNRWTDSLGGLLGQISRTAGTNTVKLERQPTTGLSNNRAALGRTGLALGRVAALIGGPGPRRLPAIGFVYAVEPSMGMVHVGGSACRFRVVRRSFVDGSLVDEERLDLDHPAVETIEWKVHVRNSKAVGRRSGATEQPGAPWLVQRNWARRSTLDDYRALILDPGVKPISGRSRERPLARFDGAVMPSGFRGGPAEGITSLGRVATDSSGNLLMHPGAGRCVSDASESTKRENLGDDRREDNRFDDSYDGWIKARIRLRDGTAVAFRSITGAWVMSTATPSLLDHAEGQTESCVDPAPGELTRDLPLG